MEKKHLNIDIYSTGKFLKMSNDGFKNMRIAVSLFILLIWTDGHEAI